ncbi:MAG TPA: molybdopterin-dependent oxidoreductase [Pseudonocardia sp.]|jgi:DMSO/TMAO reductase YedYZ molybdopterin-dependent catalytic subunit|nr:molybdopterin-dependent oxidoreductase [Pseudonocardia sp.]
MPAGVAAVGGVLAVAAAVGAGQLAAAVVSPVSSPVLAVGNAVISYSPEPLTEFAKVHFGTYDKPILLCGIGVVIALVAALAGVAARRDPRLGVVVLLVLGVLGLLAVVSAPVFSLLDVVAPTVSLAVGVGVLRWLRRLACRAYRPSAGVATSSAGSGGHTGVSRRTALIGSSAAVGVAAVGSGVGGLLLSGGDDRSRRAVNAAIARAKLVERAPVPPADAAFPRWGTPSFITANSDFYRIDVALRVPSQPASTWRMKIHGLVDREIDLSFTDLMSRPLVERTITLTCVSNPVNGNLISTANFIGAELRPLLLESGVRPGAEQLFTTSIDGWTASTPIEVVMEPDRGALLVVGMNGEALPVEHGFPVRMVVPGLYGYVSGTKWLSDMELTTFGARRGYWQQRGWAERAPIKTESRIDRPKAGASVSTGVLTCAGAAWSQPAGIASVEVRMDEGPWRPALLSSEVDGRTWRMWRADFAVAAGPHQVRCRATSADGVTQTEVVADPVPDGASGWPSVAFVAD